MQDITLGAAGETILWIVAIIGGLAGLYRFLKSAIKKILQEEFKTINKSIADLSNNVTESDKALADKIDALNMQTCKNFITRYLSDVERGVAVGEIEKERFAEEWDYYVNHDGNSYIKAWYKRLESKGFL